MHALAQQHNVMRVTTDQARPVEHRARALCSCGRGSYGADRLGALDAFCGHVMAAREAATCATAAVCS